jgi:hypothetical protein
MLGLPLFLSCFLLLLQLCVLSNFWFKSVCPFLKVNSFHKVLRKFPSSWRKWHGLSHRWGGELGKQNKTVKYFMTIKWYFSNFKLLCQTLKSPYFLISLLWSNISSVFSKPFFFFSFLKYVPKSFWSFYPCSRINSMWFLNLLSP